MPRAPSRACQKSGEVVQDRDSHLKLRDLTIEVPSHHPLAHQLDAAHLRLDQTTSVIPAPSSPDRAAQSLRRAQDLDSRLRSRMVLLPGLAGALLHRNDRKQLWLLVTGQGTALQRGRAAVSQGQGLASGVHPL